MKILFISLLRIGDFLMHVMIADAYRKKHSDCDIHFLVNDLIGKDFERLFPFITFHRFERFNYQKMINSFETPLLYPFWSLRKQITTLNGLNFDTIIDLTYQDTASSFLNLINAKNKKGVISWKPFVSTDDELIKKFIMANHDSHSNIHYLDHLKKIADVDLDIKSSIKNKNEFILFQISTSDTKKNYDILKWKSVINRVSEQFPNYLFQILCSKDDFPILKKTFNSSQLVVTDFYQTYDLLKEASLLVSLDTSIKHLAALTQTPTLEISIGSSHPVKTAAYLAGNYILSADMNCRPCSHSSSCPHIRNKCQDDIKEEQIIDFINKWICDETITDYSYRTINKNSQLAVMEGTVWTRNRPSEIYC